MARINITGTLSLLIVGFSLVTFAQTHVSRPANNSSLSYLRKEDGIGPWDLWKTQPLRRRLKTLLGDQEFDALQMNMDPAEPMTIRNGIMSSAGNRQHMGGEEEGVLIIDLDRDTIEVLLLHTGGIVKAWTEGPYVPLPPSVAERVEHWPQASLKQALASIQKSSGTQHFRALP